MINYENTYFWTYIFSISMKDGQNKNPMHGYLNLWSSFLQFVDLCKITSYLIQLIADKLLIRLYQSDSFRFICLVLRWRWLWRSEHKLQNRALHMRCEIKTFICGSMWYITIMVWKFIMSKLNIRSILFDYHLPVRSSVQKLMQYFLLWSSLHLLAIESCKTLSPFSLKIVEIYKSFVAIGKMSFFTWITS